ncbi:MAG: hypothetical protein Q7J80_05660, partial [Anaerolineales bacterium]|nr:hypothetical protein [Anaerolineales bacterium]
NAWFKRDDAYYFFKVAQNISEGHGSTFDGINLTNGYHPLWMIVCIPIFALARFDLILPLRVLLMVMAGFQAASAVLIYRMVKSNLSHVVAILAAVFWAFNFSIHNTVYEYGLETPLAVFALLYFIYKLSQFEREWPLKRAKAVPTHEIVNLALIAVVVMFSRLDLVFLAIIAGIWVIFRGKTIRHLLPLDMVIITVSMMSSVAMRTGILSYNISYASSAMEAVFLALPVKLVALYFFSAYQHPRSKSVWIIFRQILFAITSGTVITVAAYLLLIQLGLGRDFPRTAFILDWGISLLLIFALRLAARWFSNKNSFQPESPVLEFKTNWKRWLGEGSAYYGVLGGFLALYMLFNKIMFGASSPVSGQIKRWWGSMANTVYERPASNWYSFFGVGLDTFNAWNPATDLALWLANVLRPLAPNPTRDDERYYLAMLILVVAGLILIFVNKHRAIHIGSKLTFIPLIAGSGIHILSYSATSYGGAKEWYWVSQMILVTLAGSFFLDLILKPLLKIRTARLALEILSVLAGIYFAYNLGNYVVTVMRHDYFAADRPYMEVVGYLEESTPPGSIIGMTGGGNVGYLIHDRTIVNMDGLINSAEYFHALQSGEAPAFLYERGITLIFANAQLLTVPPYFGQFAPYLERYGSYGGKGLFYLLEEAKY